MGSFLSAPMPQIVGGLLLFLGDQLLHRRIRHIVLPPVWRLLGPLEAIMGVLMSGISVSVLFAIATRLIGNEAQLSAGARS
jgi:hypothetical protein